MKPSDKPDTFDFSGLEPDILELFTRQIVAMAPEFEAAIRAKKAEFAQEYGGQRYFVPKGGGRGKSIGEERRAQVYRDGLTGMSDEAIAEKHKISKTTLWRVMKSGGGRFS